MALRPEISLNPAQANLTTVLPLFQQAREARQRRDLMPLEQQVAQEGVKQAELRTAQDVLNLDVARRSELIGSMMQGASEVKPFTDRGDIQGAINQLQQRRELLVSQGLDTTQTDQAIQLAQANPAQFKNSVDALVQSGIEGGVISRQATPAAVRERESLAESLVGATNPKTGKPFTREEAVQEVALRDAGIVAREGTITGRERVATSPELTEAVAESESVIKERTKFAELTGSSRAKRIDGGFDRIGQINTSIGNIDRAISAIDEGARTGAIESRFFPSIRAASIKLDQLQNEFALDVISGVTLGAISESELELAKQVGLPKDLPEDQLRQYLVDKRAAQEKVRSYFEDQIAFLERGGTVGGFVEQQRQQRQSVDVAPPAETQAPADASVAAPAAPVGQIRFLGFE